MTLAPGLEDLGSGPGLGGGGFTCFVCCIITNPIFLFPKHKRNQGAAHRPGKW